MKSKHICKKCGTNCEGRGHYEFTYLSETIHLCGHCSQKVMRFIKESV